MTNDRPHDDALVIGAVSRALARRSCLSSATCRIAIETLHAQRSDLPLERCVRLIADLVRAGANPVSLLAAVWPEPIMRRRGVDLQARA